MFSPYYATARRRGAANPLDHCAFNVALYGPRKRWAMTERGHAALQRDAAELIVGPSALRWDGGALTIDINEITVPFPSRILGQVRVHPSALVDRTFALDDQEAHHWWPIAPCARVEVHMEKPALRWGGDGYLDSNFGHTPLELSFVRWDWSRAALRSGTAVLYDVTARDGADKSLALHFDAAGRMELMTLSPSVALPRTGWRLSRRTHADNGQAAVRKTLEDAPFYARSLISTQLLGENTMAVHESLSLDRFRSRIVQLLLPFRMPRAG